MNYLYPLLIATLLLTACDRGGQEQPLPSPPIPKEAKLRDRLSPLEQPSSEPKTQGFNLVLVPEEPRRSDTLRVAATGCTNNLTYTWSVNGAPLPAENRETLALASYAKGDLVSVSAACDGSSADSSVRIVNSPPVIRSIRFPLLNIGTGLPLEATVLATDPDGDEVTFKYHWQIDGKDLPEVTGSALPGELVAKGTTVVLTVVPLDGDSEGTPLIGKPFVIPNSPPVFKSTPPVTFQGATYTYQPTVEDPDGDTLIFSLGLAPPGMSIEPSTGRISWLLPTQGGTFQTSIVVKDQDGMEARQNFAINLN